VAGAESASGMRKIRLNGSLTVATLIVAWRHRMASHPLRWDHRWGRSHPSGWGGL